jgi:hypothetical protein
MQHSMSPEAEPLRPSDTPEQRLDFATASQQLSEQRSWSSSLGFAFAGLALSLAAAFAACGSWQAWALIHGAREVARDIGVARTTGVRPPEPRASALFVARSDGKTVLPSPPAVMVNTPGSEPDGAPSRTAAKPGAAVDVAQPVAVARAFEALAEATEKAVPLGLGVTLGDAVLDDPEGVLTLGQPPPATYPRVDCDGIFVYIVTLVEDAPRLSSASIGVGETGPARFRRPGQTVGAWTLLAISDDWSGLQPRVWLAKKGTACLAKLAGNPTRSHQTSTPPAARPAPKPAAARQAQKSARPRQDTKSATRPKARRR